MKVSNKKGNQREKSARLDVAVQVGDERVLSVAHTGAEVRDASVGLLAPAEVARWNQDVSDQRYGEQNCDGSAGWQGLTPSTACRDLLVPWAAD